jgi:hypothetical protein
MITIYYKPGGYDTTGWAERLDRISLKYEFVEDHNSTQPRLVDSEKEVTGLMAIDAYIESQEQFVNGWYEDRCDRYDFDPDTPLKINGIDHDE